LIFGVSVEEFSMLNQYPKPRDTIVRHNVGHLQQVNRNGAQHTRQGQYTRTKEQRGIHEQKTT
jgi:hypothetical protein